MRDQGRVEQPIAVLKPNQLVSFDLELGLLVRFSNQTVIVRSWLTCGKLGINWEENNSKGEILWEGEVLILILFNHLRFAPMGTNPDLEVLKHLQPLDYRLFRNFCHYESCSIEIFLILIIYTQKVCVL